MNDIEQHIVGFPESWKILARAIDKYIQSYDPNYRIDQVKEKFGGMRYYFTLSTEDSISSSEVYNSVADFAELSEYMED